MTDYKKYINALRKCAKEHENDRTSTGHIIVSDLCKDTANLLEEVEQEPKTGRWKAFIHNAYHGTDEDGEPIGRKATVYNCSQCNRRTVIKEKYFPNCGAKMV